MNPRRNPSTVWQDYGLARSRGWGRGPLLAGSTLSRATGFRSACEELGGYFQAFAVFLSGRADFLPNPYLDELEQVTAPYFGPDGPLDLPVEALEVEELTRSYFTRSFRALFGRRIVILEVAVPDAGVDQSAWKDFEAGVSELEGFPESRILEPDVLHSFHKWLDLHADLGRKRRMLETLQEAPPGCVTEIPQLIPDLQRSNILAYSLTEGQPVRQPGADGESDSTRWVEAVVEQILILSCIAVDDSFDEMRACGEGKFGYRVWPFMESLPIQHYQPLIQYVASSIAEDSGRAMRMLVRMTRNEEVVIPESEIWRELSGLRFEMDREGRFPDSVEKLVDFWKALAGSRVRVPFFLDFFQRELVLLGPKMASRKVDQFVVGVATVLSRLVKLRVSQTMSIEKAREWAVGSGLLMMGVVRQVSSFVEQLRENDLSVSVSTTTSSPNQSQSRRSWFGGVLLLASLATLQGAFSAEGSGLGTLLAAASLLCGVALVFSVARGR